MRLSEFVAAGLAVVMAGTAIRAQVFSIQSFGGTGKLTFNELSTAETYRVEWAPSPSGPWKNFADDVAALNEIMAKGSGIVTCSVPMCYRVVATLTPGGTVLVPGGINSGTNSLGEGEAYNSETYPQFYSLTVDSFYMDKSEVTKAKWDEVYSWAVTNGYNFSNVGSGKAANHPVHSVNWYDCVKWCNARSEKEGRPAVYTVSGFAYKTGHSDNVLQTAVAGYRLPTGAEWEYAARGGLSCLRFPWGDTITHSHANYNSSSSDSYDNSPTRGYHQAYNDGNWPYTSPVNSFVANGYGLYDMAGNVWEWCFDWHPSYGGSTYRMIRGGSWKDSANYSRVGYVNLYTQSSTLNTLGFRAVLSSPSASVP